MNRLLKKHDIDYQEVTAGEYKRTVSVLGEIHPEGMAKFKSQLEDVHKLFKTFVHLYRPNLNLSEVANGDHWYGSKALELGLVDQLTTSDDYLRSRHEEAKIIILEYHHKKGLGEKISESLSLFFVQTFDRLYSKWNKIST